MQSSFLIIILILVYAALLIGPIYYLARRQWKRFKALPGNPTFRYSIIDMYGAIIGLTPSIGLFAVLLRQNSLANMEAMCLFAMVAFTQLLGMLIFKLEFECTQGQGTFRSGLYVLGGAIFGPIYAFLLFVFGLMLIPIWLPLIIAFLIVRLSRRS